MMPLFETIKNFRKAILFIYAFLYPWTVKPFQIQKFSKYCWDILVYSSHYLLRRNF